MKIRKVILMKKLMRCCVFICISLSFCNATAKQVSQIELIDGGMILGRIISHLDGEYVIQSDTLGTLKVNEAKIRIIRIKHGPSIENSSSGSQEESSNQNIQSIQTQEKFLNQNIQSIQKSIMNNEKIMQKALSLQNNPQMQEILKDPDIREALDSGNFSTLLSHPKFVDMLNSPEIMEIQKEILNLEPGGR